MKIAYSINGEGFGHASRAVSLIPGLARRHDIHVFAPFTIRPWLSKKLGDRQLYEIPAFRFAKRGSRIMYMQTLWLNLKSILLAPIRIQKLAQRLVTEGYQAVISDFEPILAWAGRLAGLPVIQCNHPGIILKHFSLKPARLMASFVALLMEGPWTKRIHFSFYDGDIGPIVRPELRRQTIARGDYLVVYLKPGYQEAVLEQLEGLRDQFPGLCWRIFPDPGANFEQALAGCRAVIAAGGHQMISEALALGKPILCLPQDGQDEQFLNARMLRKTKRGLSGSLARLPKLLPEFLRRLPEFESAFGQAAPKGFITRDCSSVAVNRLNQLLRGKTAFRILPNNSGRQSEPAAVTTIDKGRISAV